jgi:hypothetical protein
LKVRDVIAQLRRGRQDLPQGLDLLVCLEELFPRLWLEKPAVDELLQLLVGAALTSVIEVFVLRSLNPDEEVLQ